VALILCPNAALIQQVLATIRALKGADGEPLLAACQVSSSLPPPFETPDVVVATPGGLVTLLRESGRHYGPLWSPEGLARRVAHVVVDEADLLTTGGYAKDLELLLEVGGASAAGPGGARGGGRERGRCWQRLRLRGWAGWACPGGGRWPWSGAALLPGLVAARLLARQRRCRGAGLGEGGEGGGGVWGASAAAGCSCAVARC
jgi:hypothetical protein